MKVTFLGAGVFGEALGNIARYNGNEVSFYDPIKFPKTTIEEVTNSAEVIVYTAPSEKYAEILPNLPKDTPLICASKGFLSVKPFAEFKNFSALGGAAFAGKIKEDAKITFTASSELAEQLFSTETITVEYTTDTLGILLCGALKNVYAIGAGMYGETENTDVDEIQHQLMPYLTEVAQEIQTVLSENGADTKTLKLSCGIADLVLSCTPNSRNFRYGRAIKEQKPAENATIEGLSVIKDLPKFPEFKLPDTATNLAHIIKLVEEYEEKYATK